MTIWRRLVLALLLTCLAPSWAHAAVVTLRFEGTAHLGEFGAPYVTTFNGSVTWDSTVANVCCGRDYARYLIGGEEGVTARLVVNGFDYTHRLRPFSRFEQFSDGLFLELYLEPAIDLDAGSAPDVSHVALDLWSRDDPAVFDDFTTLPEDLRFLGALDHRLFTFVHDSAQGGPFVIADTLDVPEPSAIGLVALGLAGLCRRRQPRGLTRWIRHAP